MLNDFVALNVLIPAGSTVFFVFRRTPYTPITDPNQLKYHIIPGKKLLSEFLLDDLTSTDSASNVIQDQMRLVNYNGKYYGNGFSEVLIKDIPLEDCYINLISEPLLIPKPVNDSCIPCNTLATVEDTIKQLPELTSFRQIYENAGFQTNTPPKTVIAPTNEYFNQNDKILQYLLYNRTKLDEFLRLYIFPGTYYPTALTTIVSLANKSVDLIPTGFNYSLVFDSGDPIIGGVIATAYPRVDGMLYSVTIGMYDFQVPNTPVAPVPTYTPPANPIAEPCKPGVDCGGRIISVSLVFLILSFLLVRIQ